MAPLKCIFPLELLLTGISLQCNAYKKTLPFSSMPTRRLIVNALFQARSIYMHLEKLNLKGILLDFFSIQFDKYTHNIVHVVGWHRGFRNSLSESIVNFRDPKTFLVQKPTLFSMDMGSREPEWLICLAKYNSAAIYNFWEGSTSFTRVQWWQFKVLHHRSPGPIIYV